MAAASPLVQAVMRELVKFPGLDPRAELAVAQQEGLSGGIGDGGHAFGPNQLNNAGGVITGKFAGESPSQINQWAWSPAGIDYALSGVAKAAGGLKGSDAVRAIVSNFERPADPSGETARALAAYGLPPQGGASISLPAAAAAGAPVAPHAAAASRLALAAGGNAPAAGVNAPLIQSALRLLGF